MRSLPGGTTLELTTRRDGRRRRADRRSARRAGRGRARRAARGQRRRRRQAAAGRGELRVRLYVSGDAPLLVAPAAAVLGELRPRRSATSSSAIADARGRLHPPDRDGRCDERARRRHAGSAARGRVFLAVLQRDLYVTWGELPVFLAQVILQPLFMLFVFGKVLGQPRLHPERLHRPALPGPRRADRGDHRACRRSRSRSWSSSAGRRRSRTGCSRRCRPRWWRAEKVLFASPAGDRSPRRVMIPVGILILGSIPWRWSGAAALRR